MSVPEFFTFGVQSDEPVKLRQRKPWSKPLVIVSEIEDTDKLINLIEITLLPTGPS
jgi:hypothetical protein